MTLNNKFDAVIQTIVSNSSNDIEIKNELVRVFNMEKVYKFSTEEIFDVHALISVILNTILEYREETKDYVRTLSEESIDTITNFDDLIKMVRYDDAGKIQLLIPICLTSENAPDLALVVSKNNNTYLGHTCLTLEMAYNNARPIARPDSIWLRP